MTRYLLLTEFFPPDPGGIQHVLATQAAWLSADLTVMAPAAQQVGAAETDPSWHRMRRSLFSGRGWPAWLWLVPWLRQQKKLGLQFVLYGHYSRAVFAAAWLSFFGMRYGIYVHGHDLRSECRHFWLRPLIGWSLRRAAWINVAGEYMGAFVREFGVPEARIISTFPVIDPPIATRAATPSHRIVTIARLVPRKNVRTAIAAVLALRKRFPDLHYDIVGDGPERRALETYVRDLRAGDVVTFHGAVTDAVKQRLLAQSDIGLLIPTEGAGGSDVEGFGIFYLEAAAVGLPVVAGRSGGVADAVVDGTTGIVVDPKNQENVQEALRRLLTDESLRRTMGQAGRQRTAQLFSSGAKQRQLMSAMDEITAVNAPLVSIIIPAWNSQATLKQTIVSALEQTWPNKEIIAVDDGSIDDTLSVAKAFGDRLTVITQPHQGAPAARNAGADRARGEFIIFLDADALMRRDMIALMARALLSHPAVSWCYGDFRFGSKNFHLFDFSVGQLRRMNYIHTSSLIRRADFPRFDETLTKFQDWDLWLTMVARGKRGLWWPDRLFSVAQRGGSMSSWLPSFVYRLPGIGQGRGNATIRKYREAETVIRRKHRLT